MSLLQYLILNDKKFLKVCIGILMYIKDEFIKKVYLYEIDVVIWKIMIFLYIF